MLLKRLLHLYARIDLYRKLMQLSKSDIMREYYKSLIKGCSYAIEVLLENEKSDKKRYREGMETFTLEELAKYDGSSGSAYIAMEGIVYDVTNVPTWAGGEHYGVTAGVDGTEDFNICHASKDILETLPKVGVLDDGSMGRSYKGTGCKKEEQDKQIEQLIREVATDNTKKINVLWIEALGCSGNILSFLNGDEIDSLDVLKDIVELRYNNSLMGLEGESAYEQYLETLDTEFILVIDGAISTKNNGILNIIGHYKGKEITAYDAIMTASKKAKHIIAMGTCACYGGISAGSPNPSESKGVSEVITDKQVINIPGCPCNPRWLIGTIAHLIKYGVPELDENNRPTLFFAKSIHDVCPRRSQFEKGIFANYLGEEGCLLKLGCKGPRTRADCPLKKWNCSAGWPIGSDSPCIGCVNEGFPDDMAPFIQN